MPNNLPDTLEQQLLDAIHARTALPALVAPMRMRLLTALGTDTTAATEVVGGTYAPQNVAIGAAAGGGASNTALVRFEGIPNPTTVVGYEIWDSSAVPRRVWANVALTANKTVVDGILEFPVGSLTFGLD